MENNSNLKKEEKESTVEISDPHIKPVIAYMMNPDKVFYNSMDDEIVANLMNQGASVIKVQLEDINFNVSNKNDNSYTLFIKDKPLIIDGFLSYGYMSKFHYEAYTLVINTFYDMGIPTLHTPQVEQILNNKYLQLLKFKKAGVSIPSSNIGFSVDSFKNIMSNFYKDFSVSKKLSDYGGDGVSINRNTMNGLNLAAKLLWKGEYSLLQTMVKDSPGQSIRVLCIENIPIACAMYNDKTGNYKSNNSFGYEYFSLDNMMESPKLSEYYSLAVKAVDSVSSLNEKITIAGVDILDSNENGLVVLEINLWPDIYDIAASTKVDVFSKFAKSFYDKVKKSMNENKDWNINIK